MSGLIVPGGGSNSGVGGGMPVQKVDIGVVVKVPEDIAARFALQCAEVRVPLEGVLAVAKGIRVEMEAALAAAEKLAALNVKGGDCGCS